MAERPDSFGRIGGDYRGALVDRFPYVVVFTVDGDNPSIFGLRHTDSNRNDWFDRTLPSANG